MHRTHSILQCLLCISFGPGHELRRLMEGIRPFAPRLYDDWALEEHALVLAHENQNARPLRSRTTLCPPTTARGKTEQVEEKMRRNSTRSLLRLQLATAAIFGALAPAVRADFPSAKATFDRGEYFAAYKEFEHLAKEGNPEAPAYIGWMYESGLGLPRDEAQAVAWFRKAAELGSVAGEVSLADMLAAGRGVAMDKAQAVVWYRKAAGQNDAVAETALGNSYAYGWGVTKDEAQAANWYRKAAEQGYAPAELHLGVLYENGLGVVKDDAQAAAWYRKAAEQGEALAQNNLGDMYARGVGVAPDNGQAAVWYRKAAEQGNMMAQYSLGLSYHNGAGVPKDDSQAFAWFQRAAEQGYASAQSNLGSMYANGWGIPKDYSQAILWYRKAAEQGDEAGELNLGQMYFFGRGVREDYAQAVYWYRKAAEQGLAQAQVNLGVAFVKGLGVPKDEEQAYFWWLLASAQGDEDAARKRDFVEQTLTSAQRAEAQAAARNWKPVSETAAAAAAPQAPSFGGVQSRSIPTSSQPDSSGTGIRITPTQYVSNYHVVQGCKRLRIDGTDGIQSHTDDPGNDLTLLSTKESRSGIATIRIGRVRVGESVAVAGFPLHGVLSGLNVTTGTISGLKGLGNDARFYQITAPVQPGNSGGPLIDASGNVLGVVESKLDAVKVAEVTGDIPQNVNFALNTNTLQSFLEANSVDFRSGTLSNTASTADIAARAKQYTVLVECWK